VVVILRIMEEYITLQQAAEIAGYADTSTLRHAARRGRLRTIKPGPRLHMTTGTWLQEYLQNLRSGDYKRGGQPKRNKSQDAGGGEAGE